MKKEIPENANSLFEEEDSNSMFELQIENQPKCSTNIFCWREPLVARLNDVSWLV